MLEIRERGQDGALQPPKNPFNQPTAKEQLELLGMQIALEKLSNMQANTDKDALIDSMGAQLVQMRIELMQLKGGGI